MRKLTKDILMEEANAYFSKKKPHVPNSGSYLSEHGEALSGTRVFPEYSEWRENVKNLPHYYGNGTATWAMGDVIGRTLDLAAYLIENDYPQKAVLAMLPMDFSKEVSKRLKRQD